MLINSLKQDKASAHDDILPYFVKIVAPIIFPDKIKLAKVIPVYKKGSFDQLNNYRPISLLSSLSRVVERLIHNRILSFFTRNK